MRKITELFINKKTSFETLGNDIKAVDIKRVGKDIYLQRIRWFTSGCVLNCHNMKISEEYLNNLLK